MVALAVAVIVALGLLLEVDKVMEVQAAILDLGAPIKDQATVAHGAPVKDQVTVDHGVPAKVQVAVFKVMVEATVEDLGAQVVQVAVTLGGQTKVLEAVLALAALGVAIKDHPTQVALTGGREVLSSWEN